MLKLTELHTLPEGFFELHSPRELHTLMPNPTLLHLEGKRERTPVHFGAAAWQ